MLSVKLIFKKYYLNYIHFVALALGPIYKFCISFIFQHSMWTNLCLFRLILKFVLSYVQHKSYNYLVKGKCDTKVLIIINKF